MHSFHDHLLNSQPKARSLKQWGWLLSGANKKKHHFAPSLWNGYTFTFLIKFSSSFKYQRYPHHVEDKLGEKKRRGQAMYGLGTVDWIFSLLRQLSRVLLPGRTCGIYTNILPKQIWLSQAELN